MAAGQQRRDRDDDALSLRLRSGVVRSGSGPASVEAHQAISQRRALRVARLALPRSRHRPSPRTRGAEPRSSISFFLRRRGRTRGSGDTCRLMAEVGPCRHTRRSGPPMGLGGGRQPAAAQLTWVCRCSMAAMATSRATSIPIATAGIAPIAKIATAAAGARTARQTSARPLRATWPLPCRRQRGQRRLPTPVARLLRGAARGAPALVRWPPAIPITPQSMGKCITLNTSLARHERALPSREASACSNAGWACRK